MGEIDLSFGIEDTGFWIALRISFPDLAGLSGLDVHQNFMGLPIASLEIVDSIGRNAPDIVLFS